MAWITKVQADNYLGDNPKWNEFTNKEELLDLASNRLEQLTFKDEPINRVDVRYLDGNSLSKVADSDDFLLEANKGNFAYHNALGWFRTNSTMDLHIFGVFVPTNCFFVNDDDNTNYAFQQNLNLKQIQNLHTFGGTFGGSIALDGTRGQEGSFSSIETEQANAIVDANGNEVFLESKARRFIFKFGHDFTHVNIGTHGSLAGFTFDGVTAVDVINEQGDTVTNTVPEIKSSDFFSYTAKVVNGLDKTMFLYVNDILVANPKFDPNLGGTGGNRLVYQSGSGTGTQRVTYVELFGATINTENPITIPIRLVGACALLAFEYGKFPPNVVGDKEYQRNKNNYNIMQDLPINVQAAVEPFLANYESLIDENGIATITERNTLPVQIFKPKMTSLEYT